MSQETSGRPNQTLWWASLGLDPTGRPCVKAPSGKNPYSFLVQFTYADCCKYRQRYTCIYFDYVSYDQTQTSDIFANKVKHQAGAATQHI